MQLLKNKRVYFLLSFIEGGSVMAAELLGAKMLAPYFGNSLYVWATVLAITLGGLAAGYFAGGLLSFKNKNPLTLLYVMLAAATFTALMPFSSRFVLWFAGAHSLIPAVIFCASCILLPPVFMMGMVSPLIIRSVTDDADQAGKAAGAVYAISTLGGILATFAFGFYIIPQFGLTLPSILSGLVLGILPALILIKNRKIIQPSGFILLCFGGLYVSENYRSSGEIKLVYHAEGILGQIQVLDYPKKNIQGELKGYSRWLFVNRISQTMYDSLADENQKEEKYFTYVYRIADFADSLPKGSKVLLLGLGGGSVAQSLVLRGMEVEACELDRRMAFIAKKFFQLDEKVKIIIDDARHYIKTCTKKYDLIVFDTFKGEDPPNHVFTLESLEEIKKLMKPEAVIIVNSMGYIDGSPGKGVRSIYKTFMAAGFKVGVMPTGENPDQRNMLFFASEDNLPSYSSFVKKDKIDLDDALVLSDEYPLLDHINAEAARRWRVMAINAFLAESGQGGIPVFY